MGSGPSFGKIITTAMIVTGFMIGAGILALPINIGPAGFWPSVAGALIVWFVMTCTGLIVGLHPYLARNPDADYPTIFEAALGPAGKWFSVAANMVIFYGLLTAYLAGVAAVAVNSFDVPLPEWAVLLIYFVGVTALASTGEAVLRRGNAALMVLMWGLYVVLLVMVIPHMQADEMAGADLDFWISGLPILVVAFNFHNVIPTLCRVLDHDRRAIKIAIWLGSGTGMLMTLLWTMAVVLALPMEATNGTGIIEAYKAGVPATVPLDKLIKSRMFVNASIGFAVVAMTTSYMATGASLLSFIKDVVGHKMPSAAVRWCIAFLPPVLVGVFYPNVFLKALNVVGGVGIGTLFGILPGVVLIRQGRRLVGWSIVAFFVCVLLVEIGQETAILHLAPDVKYWALEHARHFTE